MASRRLKIALAAGALIGVAGLAFGPIVRHEADLVAERFGGHISIESVSPTWRGVTLKGVDLALDDVPSAKIRLHEVDVELGLSGPSVALHGGKITAVGSREVVLRQVEAWRSRGSTSTAKRGADGESSRSSMDVSDLDLEWKNAEQAPSEIVTAKNVRFSRAGVGMKIAAEHATLGLGRALMTVKAGELVLSRRAGGGYGISALSAGDVDAELAIPALEESVPGLPAPTKLSEGSREKNKNNKTAHAPSEAGDRNPSTPPRGLALRRKLVTAARAIDALLEPDASIALARVTARAKRGDDVLHLGPGALSVLREPERIVIELKPGAGSTIPEGSSDEGQRSLTFRLSIPIGAREDAIEADIQGGPIWLSTLGVREGDLGLFDVATASLTTRSHLVLSADGRELSIDGDGSVKNLSIRSEALSDEAVSGVHLAWRAKAQIALDGSRVRVDEGEVDLDRIQVLASGQYERVGDEHRVRAQLDVPLASCQAMLESVPKGLAPKLQGMRMAGSFALKGKARFDTARLDRDFDVDWDVSSSCRVEEAPPDIDVARFRKPFRHQTYDGDGKRIEIETGPQSQNWVSYGSISKFMEIAVLTTEDGGFHRHRGFDHGAIKNSIRENLRKRRFVRGASTVSMQLAKNLYLDRTKNLSRKLQEAVLTMYLEQELTKEQIMELYLNVVEFGPMVYGIGSAARHYFNASSSQLSLGQALYLSSILPSPKEQYFAAGGAVTPRRMEYLKRLMQLAHGRQRITDEELEEGLSETVIRGSPAPLRAPSAESGPSTSEPGRDEGEGEPVIEWAE
ncbi:MAG: transglycosylase domain-containing protein [Polyangiaceae bacterium]|nr:transglycosylase domain-containing protein [Polyangiaceae bacterium]